MIKIRAYSLLTLLLAVFTLAISAGSAGSATTAEFRNKYLESELSLASKSKFYVVFDFEKNLVLLKARGSVFRSWPILTAEQYGQPIPLEVLPLEKRSYDSESLRVTITPEAQEEDEPAKPKPATKPEKKEDLANKAAKPTPPKLDALELVDMPKDYNLTFGKNVFVEVTSHDPVEVTTFSQKIGKALDNVKAAYALYQKKKNLLDHSQVNITMNVNDAKALYWALGDSINVIFWAAP